MESHRRVPTLLAALALAAVAAAGCSKSSTSPVDPAAQADADDAAVQVGGLLATGNGGLLVSMSTAAVPSGSTSAPAGAARATAVSSAAAETTFTVGAVTWHVVRAFYDAGGNVMADYDPVLTTRMLTQSTARGSVTMPRWSAALGHASTLDLRGLSVLQDTLRFSGMAYDTCTSAFASMDSTRTRHFHLVSAATWTRVEWLKPVATYPWPRGGTVTWILHADRLRSNDVADVEVHFDATAVVTFNGTRYVPVVVNGTWTYTLDLLTGAVVRA